MNAYIKFYINQAGQEIKLPAFVSDFKDVSTIDYETKKIPLNFSKFLPGSSERRISMSIDVFAEHYEQARDNFRNLSILNRLLFLLKDAATGNPRKTAILNVLYQNLIIKPNEDPSGQVKDVGLPCYLASLEQSIQYESGFYTFQNYVFPKLTKVSITLIPVLNSTGKYSPSWFVDAAGTINFNDDSYTSNWPYAIPKQKVPANADASTQRPSGQSNTPPASAVQAARQAILDSNSSSGTTSGNSVASEGMAERYIRDYSEMISGKSSSSHLPPYSTAAQSLESPSYSFTNKKRDDGSEMTREEQTMLARNGRSNNPNYVEKKEQLDAARREQYNDPDFPNQ